MNEGKGQEREGKAVVKKRSQNEEKKVRENEECG